MTHLPSETTDYGAKAREAAALAVVDLPDVTATELTDFLTGHVTMRFVQRFTSGRQVIALVGNVRPQDVDDLDPGVLGRVLGTRAHGRLRPWLRPDCLGWPDFEPFPRATAAWRRLRRLAW